jgi:hypothetical protein
LSMRDNSSHASLASVGNHILPPQARRLAEIT